MEGEWSNRKKVLVFGLPVVAVVLIIAMVSDTVPGFLQKRIDKNPESAYARDLQVRLAHVYRYTLRGKECYAALSKYVELYGPDSPVYNAQQRADVLYERAHISEGITTRESSRNAYWDFIEEFPDDPRVPDAEERIDSLKYAI